jgi:hypothetical protein
MSPPAKARYSRSILIGVALFAMAWAIARAAIQSITIDEAVTFNVFVFERRYLWYAANNHILNSILMYGFTKLLGISQFTTRLPALIGAALYIGAAYRLCRLLTTALLVQLTVFVCLVFNPFVFDHLVAARGYGLALAFLMWAMVYSAESYLRQYPLVVACAVSSLCAGMSVNANFSFAFVNAVLMVAIFLCARYQRPSEWIRIMAACTVPGAGIITIVSGDALFHTRPGELIYGARSLGETFGSILESSLFRSPLDFLAPVVFPLAGITGLLWLLYLLRRRAKSRIAIFGWAAAAIFAATIAIHWTAFRLFGLLLPKDRTALFFFPIFMIVAGVLASIPPLSPLGRYLRASFLGALAMMAVYFLSCLRLTYFREWYWDADVQKTYTVLSCLNREHQVTQVTSTWPYRSALNFYQIAQPTSIQAIDENFDPQQTQVYVVDTLHTPDALKGKDLKIFYRSAATDLALAASPSLVETYASCKPR